MSLDPSQSEQEAIAENFRREASRMSRGELLSALVAAVVFLAGEALLLVHGIHGHISVLPEAFCVGVFMFAARVRIDLPLGFTAPTQLAFVPMFFAAPPALVPLLVVAGMSLAVSIDVWRGKLSVGRLIQMPGNSVYALGPAAVFVLSGVAPTHAGYPLLVAALLAQFLVDFTLTAVRQLVEEGGFSFASALRDSWIYVIDAGFSWPGVIVAQDLPHTPSALLSLLPLLAVLGTFARERRRRVEGMVELGNAYRGTALVLGDVVEADDGYTGEHCKSVVALTLAVADELGLDADRRRNLEFGALLHDVGKIAIPKEIINKPGKLDANEWMIIKTHTVEGQKMLDRVGGFMHDVGLIVRSHHERWDGQGYPDRLAGQAIPLESRIITCCDSWNAMRTDRAYRRALPYETAMAELEAGAGTQFDPTVVQALRAVVERDERPYAMAAGLAVPMAPAPKALAA